MESALEEIEFLALSPNRVDVLRSLAEERHTRDDLADATGASQATLGRILDDFGDRSWIRREDGQYVATATGRLVADGFTNLLDVLQTERELRAIVRYLPTHAMDFDLGHLAEATITTPSGTRPNAPIQRLLDLIREADDVRIFSHAFNEQSLSAVAEHASEGGTFRGVFSQTALEALAEDTELRGRLTGLLESADATVRCREAGIPLAVTIADDVVHLLLRDETGVLQASIDTDEQAVRSWAHDSFDHYWRTAEPVKSDDFSA